MLDATPAQRAQILTLLQRRVPHLRALAFGSRVAQWPFGHGAKPYSDLDIALWGLTRADDLALAHLRADFEESTLPWRVDVCDAGDLPPALRDLVQAHGTLLQDLPTLQPATALAA
jgi:uncharacterized protein